MIQTLNPNPNCWRSSWFASSRCSGPVILPAHNPVALFGIMSLCLEVLDLYSNSILILFPCLNLLVCDAVGISWSDSLNPKAPLLAKCAKRKITRAHWPERIAARLPSALPGGVYSFYYAYLLRQTAMTFLSNDANETQSIAFTRNHWTLPCRLHFVVRVLS